MKAAFVDRDGTLIWEPPDTQQVDRLDQLRLLPGAAAGLQALCNAGFRLVMVSNQDGLGSPSFPHQAFDGPQQELLRILAEQGIGFDEIYVCPHWPDDHCDCRKPKLGLVQQYVRTRAIELQESLVIGDRESDAEFARNLGVPFIRTATNGHFPRLAAFCRRTRETS